MKKTFLLMAIAQPLGLMLPTSCSEKRKAVTEENTGKQAEANASGNDTCAEGTNDAGAKAETDGINAADPVLTGMGVGPVKMGTNINKLPETSDGLYDRKKVEIEQNDMDGDMKFLKLYLHDTLVATVSVNEENYIYHISVTGKAIKPPDGLYAGMPVKDLAAKKVSWAYYNDGTLYAEDSKFYYNLDFRELSAAGERRAETASDFGKASDFKPTATVKSISIKSEDF